MTDDDLSYESGTAVLAIADDDAPDRLEVAVAHIEGRIVERANWDSLTSQRAMACDVIVAEAEGVSVDRSPPCYRISIRPPAGRALPSSSRSMTARSMSWRARCSAAGRPCCARPI